MMGWSKRPEQPTLIEPVPVQEFFVDRMAEVHEINGFYEIILAGDQRLNGETMTIAKVRLLIPKEAWHAMIRQAVSYTGVAAGPGPDRYGKVVTPH